MRHACNSRSGFTLIEVLLVALVIATITPSRDYNFDVEFLNPMLLPPRTPMFRDINTLTFRQLLRPTQ